MGLETGSTISSLITSNPTSSDPINQGDNHIRLIKSVLQSQFPGSAGNGFNTAITTTEAELNSLHNSGIENLVTNVHADSSGKVGIGTSSPATKLNIVGNIGIGTLTGDNAYNPTSSSLIIQGGNQTGLSTYTAIGNATTTALISYYSNSSDGYSRYLDIAAIGSTGGAGSNIRFLTGSTSATESMRIDSSGNVKINGTTLLSDAGFMFNSDGSQDTGISWASDGVMNVRCNASTVGQFNSTGFTGNAASANYAPLISSTTQSLSGTTVNFTGIPSWSKRITIMFTGLSTNGTSPPLIQLGTGATPTYATTGYAGSTDMWQSAVSVTSISSGINLFGTAVAAASTYQGCVTLTLMSGNTWFATFIGSELTSARLALTTASISLSGTLTAIRFYINGTQAFDAGSANIMWE